MAIVLELVGLDLTSIYLAVILFVQLDIALKKLALRFVHLIMCFRIKSVLHHQKNAHNHNITIQTVIIV